MSLWAAAGAIVAPAAVYAESGKLLAWPAPLSTVTARKPFFRSVLTPSGVTATRCSPEKVSFGTPIESWPYGTPGASGSAALVPAAESRRLALACRCRRPDHQLKCPCIARHQTPAARWVTTNCAGREKVDPQSKVAGEGPDTLIRFRHGKPRTAMTHQF